MLRFKVSELDLSNMRNKVNTGHRLIAAERQRRKVKRSRCVAKRKPRLTPDISETPHISTPNHISYGRYASQWRMVPSTENVELRYLLLQAVAIMLPEANYTHRKRLCKQKQIMLFCFSFQNARTRIYGTRVRPASATPRR